MVLSGLIDNDLSIIGLPKSNLIPPSFAWCDTLQIIQPSAAFLVTTESGHLSGECSLDA
jgi:hypothetical protein